MNRTTFVAAHAFCCSIATVVWLPAALGQECETKVYDDLADFESGFAINANTDSGSTLEVNAIPKPLPYLWVAKSGVDTMVRIDTSMGEIIGEYWTRPSGRDGNPSRTTVSLLGNAFATNRDESSYVDGVPMGSVVSVGVVVGGTRVNQSSVPDVYGRYIAPPFEYCTCVDRDNDGLIHTSVGRNQLGEPDVLAWPSGGDDWRGGGLDGDPARVEDAEDECILVYQRVHGLGVRHVSVDDDGRVWVGGHVYHAFDLLDGENGAIQNTFNVGRAGYGGLVDGRGLIWSVWNDWWQPGLLRYDTKGTLMIQDDTWQFLNLPGAYGIGIDSQGMLWVSRGDKLRRIDSAGNMISERNTGGSGGKGVAVTWENDHPWVANSGGYTVSRLYDINDVWYTKVIPLNTTQAYEQPTGVAVDAAGKVWTTCQFTHYAKRIDPNAGTNGLPGLGAVDLEVPLGAGAAPYNYSDMTGYVGLGALKHAVWDDVYDSQVAGARWARIDWNRQTCPQGADTSIRVQARAAETEAGVTRQTFREVYNGWVLAPALVGRFIEVRVILNGTGDAAAFESPALCDLTLNRDVDPILDPDEWVDCNDNDIYDPCEFDDCNFNCIPDEQDILNQTSDDCQPNGAPDECEPDCDVDGIPDECEMRDCPELDPECKDCNRNGIPDGCDVSAGTSQDCNADGIPDECSGDCNHNEVWDACDVYMGDSEDCQGDLIPDECQIDEAQSEPDPPYYCDPTYMTCSQDLNRNGVPDECEDCNDNGIPDMCDMDCFAVNCGIPGCGQFAVDCNSNGTLDVCDTDCNETGLPDACDECVTFLGDVDRDCDSDLFDFAAFQRCYEISPPTGVCACEMDMDTNGIVDEADYLMFAGSFNGPGEGEPESLGDGFGGGGESFGAFAAGPESGSEDAAGAEPPATNATVELRPVGGGAAVTTLTANTTYEVHYATEDLTAVNYFAMFGVTDSAETGIAAAAQATSGDWADAQWFEFRYTEIEGVEPVQHGWMPPGFARRQVVESEFLVAAAEDAEDDAPLAAGPSGLLCTITTGEAGEFYLEIYLSLLDPAADSCEDAYGLARFDVTP